MRTSHITTHVLDTALGRPAAGVPVELHARNGQDWSLLASGTTDADGRVNDLGPKEVAGGNYRLRFDTAAYFAATSTEAFFPEITLTFTVADGQGHYHVPVLLSPFAFSTYRGS